MGNSYYGIKLIIFLNKFCVRQVETIDVKTDTIGPYFLWLYIKEAIRKMDGLMGNRKIKKRYLSADRRERFKSIYSEDNKKLKEYLDRPIRELGYYY